jgi:hypothetical protein
MDELMLANKKLEVTAEEQAQARAELKQIARSANRDELLAMLVGAPYDNELPIAPVIEAIFDIKRPDVGEDVEYFAPTSKTKKVVTLDSTGNVTQEAVSISSPSDLTFADMMSKDFYVKVTDLLKGKYNALQLISEEIQEALNREEIYKALQVVDAGAVSAGNTFDLESGATRFTWTRLVDMVRAIAKYGKNLVLITGGNVTTDIMEMDFLDDKNRKHGVSDLVQAHYAIEDLQVEIDGSDTTVMNADVAYVVALSDSKGNKPGIFARRKLNNIDASDTVVSGERAVMTTGNMKPVGSNTKFSKGIAGFQEVGTVLLNSACVAKFSRS